MNSAELPRLFHVSDIAGISIFEPRVSRMGESLVWAVGEPRLANYLLPRDCPRVTFYANQDTSEKDKERFLGAAEAVIAIESAWFNRCLEAKLYLYEFDSKNFRLRDDIAYYYVSNQREYPLSEIPIQNVLEKLLETGTELRIMPSLWELREAVITSTLAFSINRFRNASVPPDGFITQFNLP
jgi:hypothetical protein